jgi:hypothetical protein
MRGNRVSGCELTDLRGLLARLTFETRLLRYGRQLAPKDWSDQPRAPSGQPDGGRWVSGGGRTPVDDPVTIGSLVRDDGSVVTEDGSRVLSIRIRAQPRPFDEQHFVTSPDGESRIFETSGLNQTVRDGETGEVLGRSAFTAQGAEPEARIQPARSGVLATAAAAVTERTAAAAMAILSALSRQNDRYGTAALGLTATGFLPKGRSDFDTAWVGRLSRERLDAACPRAGEVKAIADEAADYVRSQIEGLSPQEFGNRVHLRIRDQINSQRDPKFVAEISLSRTGDQNPSYGTLDTYRLDVLEQTRLDTVCVYDHKTGVAGLSARRIDQLVSVVERNYPGTRRIIVIEVRPGR